tara:strand:+ start:333 stop:491 length:159 start_codon:yes stop_codon:yes gene_type:complete
VKAVLRERKVVVTRVKMVKPVVKVEKVVMEDLLAEMVANRNLVEMVEILVLQ